MKFNVRVLSEEDYDSILSKWWKDWGFTPPIKELLPLNGQGGIIVEWEKTPVCAGFLYETNSGIAWVEWIISNKNFRLKPQRKDGIHLVIQTLTDVAKNKGYKVVFSNNNNQHLQQSFVNMGYLKGNKSVELIKNL